MAKNEDERLNRLMAQDDFRTEINTLKARIAMGRTLEETRRIMGFPSNSKRWEDLLQCVSALTLQKNRIFLEYHLRTQVRYTQIQEAIEMAKDRRDVDTVNKMILILIKLDKDYIDTAMMLGVIKPEPKEVGDDGEGYDSAETEQQLAEYEKALLAMYRADEEKGGIITLELQSHPEAEQRTYLLEGTPLANGTTEGPVD